MTADLSAPSAVTGAWRPGDPVGSRRFERIGTLELESGVRLPDVTVAYETWGTHNGRNAVLVLHALTGDSHVAGRAGDGHPTPGWWDALVGPGKAIDTDRLFVVAANILGGCQGTTGPASLAPDGQPWGSRFPYLTVRDQVAAEAALADRLGIARWRGVVGGSAGGMRALEWAIMYPARVERLLLLATSAWASAEQIGWTTTQAAAIRSDAHFRGGDYYGADDGPWRGLEVARRIAHVTYRSEPELQQRFGRTTQTDEPLDAGGQYAVDSYLAHHGSKLSGRFDANSYLVLGDAMNSHDVGRGRGGVETALRRVTARTVVAGIDSDRLYLPSQQEVLAEGIASCKRLDIVNSLYGHDGFLIEADQVSELAGSLLG